MLWGRGIFLVVILMAFGCNVAPSDTGPDPVCGNGTVETGEACDDGEANSDDYSEGSLCNSTCSGQAPSCGDGIVNGAEECDSGADNDDAAADACRSTCESPVCGDGVVDSGETCDAGSDNSDAYGEGERCNAMCTGYAPYCGDGVLDDGEACDEGAENSDEYGNPDLCNTSCTGSAPYCGDNLLDPEEECDAGVETGGCDGDCTLAMCGDGHTNPVAAEECDDANDSNTDDCVECAWPRCGDGHVHEVLEGCDDGNAVTEECDYGVMSCTVCSDDCAEVSGEISYCGDGMINGTLSGFEGSPEACDDGGDSATCNSDCTTAGCGDGYLNLAAGEQCEDGNEANDDACVACMLATCGDSHVQEGVEGCDDGNLVTEVCAYGEMSCTVCGDTCASVSGAIRYCGDGVIDEVEGSSESCDDGNTITEVCAYGDLSCTVCSDGCHSVAGEAAYCGDGTVDETAGELCDEGSSNTDEYTPAATCNTSCSGVSSHCGDGVVDTAEYCDEGAGVNSNTYSLDPHCNAACSAMAPYCGDGTANAGEFCDDGAANADGYAVDLGCNIDCTAGVEAYCGDRVVNGPEDCEALGPIPVSITTTSDSYPAESAWELTNSAGTVIEEGAPSAQYSTEEVTLSLSEGQYCLKTTDGYGDGGLLAVATIGGVDVATVGGACGGGGACWGYEDQECFGVAVERERCDYGETECVVCSLSCLEVAGITSYCGDGVVDSVETCDSGTENTDEYGQPDLCMTTCSGFGSYCGDGINDAEEFCDYGSSNSDAWSYYANCGASCAGYAPYCGDSVVDENEGCDDGNKVTEPCPDFNAACTVCAADCTEVAGAFCGNGVRNVEIGEACDDGNSDDGDGCSSDCQFPGMVLVPAGSFWMGCNAGVDENCRYNEDPYHSVYVSEYSIDAHEIRAGQYKACVEAGGCSYSGNPGGAGSSSYESNHTYDNARDNYPINYIDWYQARGYCLWLGKRLPTEAEWEKAARGTDGLTYPWGNSPEASCEYVVMSEGGYGCGTDFMMEVGSKPLGVSPYGAHDMIGNVTEWTADWRDNDYYEDTPSGGWVDPQGPSSGYTKIFRGGMYTHTADSQALRAAYRYGFNPTWRGSNTGFRCVQ